MISGPPNSQDDFGLILHICLELIESGEESIESLIIRYPETKDFLRPPLEAALWLHQRSKIFDPTPAFLISSRLRLVSTVQLETGYPIPTRITQLSSSPTKPRRWNVVPSIVFHSVVLILLIVSLISTGFWVDNSLPGDPLYQVKLAKEQLQLAISFSREKDAELGIQFVERRLVETERMILSGRERYLPLAVLKFEMELHQTRQDILELAVSEPQHFKKYSLRLDYVVHRQVEKLKALSGFYPAESQTLIDRVIKITSNGSQIPIDE